MTNYELKQQILHDISAILGRYQDIYDVDLEGIDVIFDGGRDVYSFNGEEFISIDTTPGCGQ